MHRMQSQHEDNIDLVGKVLMARVNIPRMALELDDGRELEAIFPKEDEQKIIAALKDHACFRVRIHGRGFFDARGKLQKITRVDQIELLEKDTVISAPSIKPIWEEIDEIISAVPEEEIKLLPKDGAERHDYYLYGGSSRDS